MTSATRRQDAARQVDAVMRASRALIGIAAASIATVDSKVTVPQLRVLMMLSTRGPLNLLAVAEALEVNPSNASRTCDRLLKAGLLDRRRDAEDRRNLNLSLTPEGVALVDRVTSHRRTAVGKVLRKMSPVEREQLADALDSFAAVAGEPAYEEHIGLVRASEN